MSTLYTKMCLDTLQRHCEHEKNMIISFSNYEWKISSKEGLDKYIFLSGSTQTNNGSNDKPMYHFIAEGNKKIFINPWSNGHNIVSQLKKQIDKIMELKQMLLDELTRRPTPDFDNRDEILYITDRGLKILLFDHMIKYVLARLFDFKQLMEKYLYNM